MRISKELIGVLSKRDMDRSTVNSLVHRKGALELFGVLTDVTSNERLSERVRSNAILVAYEIASRNGKIDTLLEFIVGLRKEKYMELRNRLGLLLLTVSLKEREGVISLSSKSLGTLRVCVDDCLRLGVDKSLRTQLLAV